MSNDIESLDGMDTGILNRKGWHFITQYIAKEDDSNSTAHNHAVEKATSITLQSGIRRVEKDNHVFFEVWENWK